MKIIPIDTDDMTAQDVMDFIKDNICEGDEDMYKLFLEWTVEPMKRLIEDRINERGKR